MRAFFCVCLTAAFSCPAVVRTLFMDANQMETVRPAIGRSTVLRFPKKPGRVIVGNQNYYKIEFTGDDLTIQPQGAVPTNLFVYADGGIYGFLLSPVTGGDYDDLVTVRAKKKPKGPPFPVGVEIVEIEERTLGRGLATLSLVLTKQHGGHGKQQRCPPLRLPREKADTYPKSLPPKRCFTAKRDG